MVDPAVLYVGRAVNGGGGGGGGGGCGTDHRVYGERRWSRRFRRKRYRARGVGHLPTVFEGSGDEEEEEEEAEDVEVDDAAAAAPICTAVSAADDGAVHVSDSGCHDAGSASGHAGSRGGAFWDASIAGRGSGNGCGGGSDGDDMNGDDGGDDRDDKLDGYMEENEEEEDEEEQGEEEEDDDEEEGEGEGSEEEVHEEVEGDGVEEGSEETLSSSEDISQSAAEGDRAALEKDESSKIVGAEELFVLFGRLRFKRLRDGLMSVACNRKESCFWPFSTWCPADGSGGEEVIDERSSGSSVRNAGRRDVSDAVASSYEEVGASDSDDAEFLQSIRKRTTSEERESEGCRKERERVEWEAWWRSLTPDEKQVEIEWLALKAMYKVGFENTNGHSSLSEDELNASEIFARGRSLERLARERCGRGVRLRLCGGAPKSKRGGAPKAKRGAHLRGRGNAIVMRGVEARAALASTSEAVPTEVADDVGGRVGESRSTATA